VENQRGGALLAGPSGSGKTLLWNMLAATLDENTAPRVHVVFPQMSADGLMAFLADELSGSVDQAPTPDVQKSIRRIERFLDENTHAGRHAVVVVDEAHLIDDNRTFEALRLLTNFQVDGRPALALLLIGQPGILPTLDRMPQLEERFGVKSLLRPFTETETSDYVAHRLKTAGRAEPILEPEALGTLHHLTHGVARRINRLLDLALLIGYAEQQRSISAAQLEAVSQELITVAPE
jgi:general secretion pathway protein A